MSNEELIKKIVEDITPNFTINSTVRVVAIYVIVNHSELTQEEQADIVVRVFANFGIRRATTGNSIAWYKQDMKKKGGKEEIKASFSKYLETCTETEKNEILGKLAIKHVDTLLKVVDVTEIQKVLPIKDNPDEVPTEAQIAGAREEAEKPKVAVLPTAKKLKKKTL